MKVDLVVAEAKAALAQGFAVVIGLQQTGEVWAGFGFRVSGFWFRV